MKHYLLLFFFIIFFTTETFALDNKDIVVYQKNSDGYFPLIVDGNVPQILCEENDLKGISLAIENLSSDFEKVSGNRAPVIHSLDSVASRPIIIGSVQSQLIKRLISESRIQGSEIVGKNEKYVMTTVSSPFPGVDEALVIAGSDRRGTIYGIYELSEQLGVSPWYDWADVPVVKRSDVSIRRGTFTAGEPRVKYRGIFLNDEAPCLTDWVKNTYGTNYGEHRFYSRVCELILRLRGNFLWPAMWGWAFYADDPENSRVADEMGVIIGTSHHEPMARNHQEYARKRDFYGPWNYTRNQKNLDRFFAEGIERMKGTEDVVTIGMRGDGDEAMSEDADVKLLEKIIRNQRNIIKKVTGRPAKKTPQVWALYKEVLDYYDKGLRAPDDVIYLLCDDNWGNVRRIPTEKELEHPGGFGLYYHVDYVGAPRNSKLLNVTPIQNMWEQLTLAAGSGIDKLWILNVGDLKPMEYPITLFLDMAWNPDTLAVDNLLDHPREFCRQAFGEAQADEAARILNLYSKYNGRVTPEMLDCNTFNIETGEWRQVADEYIRLEAEALRQFNSLPSEYRDAYRELVLFPVQLMANLYDMYYSQAMNHKLYSEANPEANIWADKVEAAFKRDSMLMNEYSHDIAGGKWNGMMGQKHIGYTSWNDNFEKDTCPEVKRVSLSAAPEYVFSHKDNVVVMEAEHFNTSSCKDGKWTVIPHMGRTLSGVELLPHSANTENAVLNYRFSLPEGQSKVKVHVIVKSTLAFKNLEGHRYSVALNGCDPTVVNFNGRLNEDPENVYSVFYPTVARRVVENVVEFEVGKPDADGLHTISISPLDPGIVFEKIVVDCGGYKPSYLFMPESDCRNVNNSRISID